MALKYNHSISLISVGIICVQGKFKTWYFVYFDTGFADLLVVSILPKPECKQWTWSRDLYRKMPDSMVSHVHDDDIKWKHFQRYWPSVRGIHRSPVTSPHKGQWRGALMFSLICAWINIWVNNREAGDLRRNRAHCDAIVMVHWLHNITNKVIWGGGGILCVKIAQSNVNRCHFQNCKNDSDRCFQGFE